MQKDSAKSDCIYENRKRLGSQCQGGLNRFRNHLACQVEIGFGQCVQVVMFALARVRLMLEEKLSDQLRCFCSVTANDCWTGRRSKPRGVYIDSM